MTDALLETRNLETFYGPIMAISGISLSVPKGKIVTVLGATGAGKTTLLKTISGAIDCKKGQMAGFLSGGQQQMLAIGRALMGAPDLMILDEPSLGLSPLLTQTIFRILWRINQERGVSILLVEQNANAALQIGDHGYVLELGRVVMEAPCAELLESDDIKEFYLGKADAGVRGEKRWKKRKTWR